MKRYLALISLIALTSCGNSLDRALAPCGHVWYGEEEAKAAVNSPECQAALKQGKYKGNVPNGDDGVIAAMPMWF